MTTIAEAAGAQGVVVPRETLDLLLRQIDGIEHKASYWMAVFKNSELGEARWCEIRNRARAARETLDSFAAKETPNAR